MEWVVNFQNMDKIINKSELARSIGLSPETFRKKLNNINYNKFKDCEIIAIQYILTSDVEAFFNIIKLKK